MVYPSDHYNKINQDRQHLIVLNLKKFKEKATGYSADTFTLIIVIRFLGELAQGTAC